MSEIFKDGQIVGLVRSSRRVPKSLIYVEVRQEENSDKVILSQLENMGKDVHCNANLSFNFSFPELSGYLFPENCHVWKEPKKKNAKKNKKR